MDIVSATLQAEAQVKPAALGFAFAAGVFTCIGPCSAPRLIAIISLGSRRSWKDSAVTVLAYLLGLCAMYATWGFAASMLCRAVAFSTWTYAGLGVGLTVAGLLGLMRPDRCRPKTATAPPRQLGGIFLLGASMALTVSPCCAPIILGAATLASQSSVLWACAVLVVFALGHALPVVAAAAGGATVSGVLSNETARRAIQRITASLSFALGAYYAVLA
ncbi:MAG TPA: cytochrome c biogenesis protein CcdA [Candidatus Rubrimentiphilum sp.]|nr:cytochrome c biogenesis protein CcdA [Candidatus Rubrimentiphilum sp.]